jgi:hypothetical protein
LWQKRWCVLSEGALNYYDSPASGKPNGSIPIAQCTAVASMSVTEAGGKRGCFKLVTPSRTFFFQAETAEAAHVWLQDLLEVHGILVGQDVHNAAQAIESVRRRMSSVGSGLLGRLSGTDSDMALPMVTPEPDGPVAADEPSQVDEGVAGPDIAVEPDAVVPDSAQRIEALFDSPSNKTRAAMNPFEDDAVVASAPANGVDEPVANVVATGLDETVDSALSTVEPDAVPAATEPVMTSEVSAVEAGSVPASQPSSEESLVETMPAGVSASTVDASASSPTAGAQGIDAEPVNTTEDRSEEAGVDQATPAPEAAPAKSDEPSKPKKKKQTKRR